MKKYLMLGLLAVLFLSGFGTIHQVTADVFDDYPPLKYGVTASGALIPDMDPQMAWDSASIDAIDQIAEPLFGYDLRDPELGYEFRLATGMGTWSANKKEYTVILRQNVTFHNGDAFNATAVQTTFERLNDLIDEEVTQIAELYVPLALNYPTTPLLINHTVINSDYNITFFLNYVYGAFEPLLTFSGSYIMSPTQMAATYNETSGHYQLLDSSTDILVGTGPYVLDAMVADQLTFVAFDDYWRAKPQIREMHWIQYGDATTMAQALLAGDLHLCSGAPSTFIAQFEADEDLIVHPKKQTAVIQYLGFNCGAYNKTMRQAMSYALDYDYYIDEILQGNGVRMTSIVPTGMKFHVDCNVATYNVTHARKILCDAGIAPDELTPTSDDAYWIGLAAATPILTVNYTYNLGNEQRADMATATRLMLRKIGVKCSTGGLTWSEYLDALYNFPERAGIFALGWAPDYNDPSNYINPLLMSTSAANHFSYYDDDMDQMMADALEITDEEEKADAYEEIQRKIAEDEMPLAFLMYGVSRTVHSKKVCDIPRNVMSKLDFYEFSYKDVDFCTAPPTTTTPVDTDTTPPIAGYGFFALLGACALSIAAIVMKKRH